MWTYAETMNNNGSSITAATSLGLTVNVDGMVIDEVQICGSVEATRLVKVMLECMSRVKMS